MEIRPIPALPPKRAGNIVFHSTNVSMWEIHDMAVYTQHKDNFDEIIGTPGTRLLRHREAPGHRPQAAHPGDHRAPAAAAAAGPAAAMSGYTDGELRVGRRR